MDLKIGFAGLGMMGLPMAENLARAPGLDITVYDRDPQRAQLLKGHEAWNKGLRAATRLEDLADCAVVITMLPNSPVTNAVVAGSGADSGLLQILAPGAVVVDMGSSNPADTLKLAAALEAAGIALVDAPVSGAVAKARTGTLAIMVGGDPAAFERVRPVLEHMGATLIRTGRTGSAHAMKALNNYVYAAGLLAASEAMLIAREMDLDPVVFTEVLNASSGRNVATETKLRQFIIPEDFNGGFQLRLQAKDLATADGLQVLAGVSAPQLSLCSALWKEASAALPPQADNTEVYRFLRERQQAPAKA